MSPRTRAVRSDGVQSRTAILEAATRLASLHGLDGLSIGALARSVGMSKSGLYAHFDSKEALQRATVAAARDVFVDRVVRPALEEADAVARLRRLCHGYLDYVGDRVFPGGCFFVSAATEFGPRTGAVHDDVAAAQKEWSALLAAAATAALGDRGAEDAAERLAFELGALVAGASVTHVLHDDPGLLDHAHAAVDAAIDRAV